jgi:hypothetical protein
MPAPIKVRSSGGSRGKVVRVPKSLTAPKLREPKPPKMSRPRVTKGTAPRLHVTKGTHVTLKDSVRLRVPRAKVVK